ncbi:MAG TPA: YgjP-like metallopeptidase domain-containing protein, partial [Candidatus Saccharimonadales bacterium]|nr:YgjP-like metallopeptidase domain-containing protein [Candidatus Saccharimonadales bacterium]
GIKYLISKKDWISKHRLPEPEGYKDGQMITEDTVLRIIETDKKRASYSIQPGSYIIYIPSAYKEAKRKSVIEKYIKSLLKRECENRLVPLLERMAKNEKIRIKEIRVKSMKSRWGSCNHENVITLNSALVLVPVELAEYVLCHELAHTRHLNHGEKFWREVEKMLPDYKIRRKRMRKYNSAKII